MGVRRFTGLTNAFSKKWKTIGPLSLRGNFWKQPSVRSAEANRMERFGPCAGPRICPLCKGELLSEDVPPGKFTCKHCCKLLQPSYFRGYLWVRGLCCGAGGVIWAFHSRFGGSFLVFVIALYALPLMVAWDLIVQKLFLPKRLEPVGPYIPSIVSND